MRITTHLLLVFCLGLSAAPALACKLFIPPDCKKPGVAMDLNTFVNLREQNISYKNKLDTYMDKTKGDGGRTSCFGMNGAESYASTLERQSKQHDGKVCADMIKLFVEASLQLADQNSPEHKSVADAADKADLKKQSKELVQVVEQFKKKHALQ